MKMSQILGSALLAALLSFGNLAIAKDKAPRVNEINISSVTVDYDMGILTINGQNFPVGTTLNVELGGGLMSLSSVTQDTIVAALPPAFPDGDYLLTVSDGRVYDEYDLTILNIPESELEIGACGEGYAIREIHADGSVVCDAFIKGSSETTITIESGTGDVNIVAGATLIRVKQDGEVVIEGETVNISGTDINMNATDSISMQAGPNSMTLDNIGFEFETPAADMSIDAFGISQSVSSNEINLDVSGISLDALMVDLQADTQMQIQAPMLNLDGSAMTTIKGGILMLN